ncbi:hypothetical protein OROHE_016329 [Orobanche hederae]
MIKKRSSERDCIFKGQISLDVAVVSTLGDTGFYLGKIGEKDCVFKFFSNFEDMESVNNTFINARPSPCIPNHFSNWLFSEKVHCLPDYNICFDVPYQPIIDFFKEKIQNLDPCAPFYHSIRKYYEGIFFGSLRSMIDLYDIGFIVNDFINSTTVLCSGDTSLCSPCFLDIARRTDDSEALIIQLINELVACMICVLELSGRKYNDKSNGLPEDLLNFLTKCSPDYVQFMAARDANYVMNDPILWDFENKIIKSWYMFMFFEDNQNPSTFEPYFERFPGDWKRYVKRSSFNDTSLTNHFRLKKEENQKIVLAEKLIQREIEKRNGSKNFLGKRDIFSNFKKKFKEINEKRGLDYYPRQMGARWVVKLKRNTTNHRNQSAQEQGERLETLKKNLEIVENDFGFSCSRLFWFFNELWFCEEVTGWESHKAMLKGEESWQDQFDKMPPKEESGDSSDDNSSDLDSKLREWALLDENSQSSGDVVRERASPDYAPYRGPLSRNTDKQPRNQVSKARGITIIITTHLLLLLMMMCPMLKRNGHAIIETGQEIIEETYQVMMEADQEITESCRGIIEKDQEMIGADQETMKSCQVMIEKDQDMVEADQENTESCQGIIETDQEVIEADQETIGSCQVMIETDQVVLPVALTLLEGGDDGNRYVYGGSSSRRKGSRAVE